MDVDFSTSLTALQDIYRVSADLRFKIYEGLEDLLMTTESKDSKNISQSENVVDFHSFRRKKAEEEYCKCRAH